MNQNNPIRNLMVLDLEMNQPSGKIIQVGGCVGDLQTGNILQTFSFFINPEERLSDYIIKLTGITEEDVRYSSVSLDEAYKKMVELHKFHNCFRNLLTWGGGDSEELKQQMGNPKEWHFGRRWIDAKTLFVSLRLAKGEPVQGGLAKSMTKLGLQFVGRKHNAKDDAVNTFRMYHALLKQFHIDKMST